jgi:hypothetical protein
MTQWTEQEVLVVVKAYPNPSQKYIEASCVTGVTREREWVRLYPVRDRMLESDQQFSKYTWVQVRLKKSTTDPRPESHIIDLDSIQPGDHISTHNNWAERKEWLRPLLDPSLCHLQRTQPQHNRSIGFIHPQDLRLVIKPTTPQWTKAELATLSQQGFFDKAPRKRLEKIPFNFYYCFRCEEPGCGGHRMKVVDWEICESYRKWHNQYGDREWREKLVEKYERQMQERFDTHFFVGTMLQHPQSWIVIGLFYPPRVAAEQLMLL